MKRYLKNQKIHQKFQHLFKAKLILLAKTSTPGQYTDFSPSLISLTVTTRRRLAFYSWLTEPTWRKDSCNNIQIQRCTPVNAWAKKSASYLHVQTEQLLGAC